jgi:dolichyl-phosphate-mannose-protein mannosyltransferase/PA14 domain-containing protein
MVASESSALRHGAMIAAIGAALYAQRAVHSDLSDSPMWWLLAAAAALAAAVAGPAKPLPAVAAVPTERLAAPAVRIGLGVLAVAAVAGATVLAATDRLAALLLWLASPLLGSWAVRGWAIAPPRHPQLRWSGQEAAWLGAIVVLAALARTLWLATLPHAYFGDEPRVAMYLHDAFHSGALPNFFSMGWNTWPAVGLSLQGLFAPLFGLHLWTLRLSSALMGTLGVLATYLLTRELFARRAALLATLLFAVCRTAIDFSRLGITHAQVLCLEPFALFFLWRALNGGRAVAYLWAGVVTAWCLYSYNAGQLVPLLVFGWLLLGGLSRPARLRTHWRAAALLAAAFALTLFPYLYKFTDAFTFGPNWDQWTIMARNRQTLGRVVETWQSSGAAPAWAILSHHAWTTWLGFGVLPGGGYVLGYRHGGMLDDVSAALFVLGLGIAIRRLRSGGAAFVSYWWLGTVLAGGIATVDPPSFVRMIGLLPALAILAALPLDWLLDTAVGTARQTIAAALVLLLVAGAAWDNYQTYFVAYAATRADPMSELARYMESLPADDRAALLGVEDFLQFRGEMFRIEFPGRWQDVAEPSHFLPLHEPLAAPLALVLGPTQITLADYLRSLYPGAVVGEVADSSGQTIFRTVLVTPDDVRARTGLALSARRADGSSIDLEPADPFAGGAPEPDGTERLSWRGSVYWPTDHSLPVTVDAAQATTVTIGNAPPIVAGANRPISSIVTLPRGWQPIQIDEAATPARRLTIGLGATARPDLLTRWALRPESAREGLSARYVRADGSTVSATDPQLDAFAVEDHLPPDSELLVRMPFTVTWRGALRVDTAGTYTLEAVGSGPYTVRLDGASLLAATPLQLEEPTAARVEHHLEPGLHPIEVDFDSTRPAHTTRRLFQLFWTPPGGSRELVPPSHFVPPADD